MSYKHMSTITLKSKSNVMISVYYNTKSRQPYCITAQGFVKCC